MPPLWMCFILFMWKQWRGKWQTGIRCCRADCPLPTLRAKPTHDRKSYVVVFFPRTKTYSWVDMLLVLPIEECPLPLVNGTHRKWRKLVKDLNIPRRLNMQNLAVFMINLIDELHIEVGSVLIISLRLWLQLLTQFICLLGCSWWCSEGYNMEGICSGSVLL